MKTQVESVTDVKKLIHFEIPWDELEKEIKETVRSISKNVRIPGFRPGKAPESVIRNRFASQIKDEVIRHIVPKAYREVLDQQSWEIVSEPAVQDVLYTEGSPFLFKIAVETKPQIELKEYKGIELQAEKLETKDEEIDAILKNHQERTAELIPIPDQAAEKGHFVTAKVQALAEKDGKKQKLFDDRTHIEIGSDATHSSFTENLSGKKSGETVEFRVEYPPDYPEKAIAGKTIQYAVEVESINERRIAPLDDEFAKDVGDYSTLEELKEKIRADLLRAKEAQQKSHLRDELLKALIEKNPFEVPEGLVQREADSLLQSYAISLKRRNVDIENPNINWEEIRAQLLKQADQNVRGHLLIESIAKAEQISVSEEDIDHNISQVAEQERRPPEAVRAELLKQDKMGQFKNRILVVKTIDFLLDQAKIRYT